MTSLQLRCPSCKNAQNLPHSELKFGGEVRCNECGTTSLIVKDYELRLRSEIDIASRQICSACGDITSHNARFCQNGHPLVHKCINCKQEISISHNICD